VSGLLPFLMLFALPLVYDPGVFDVLDTKQDFFALGVFFWALWRLFQGDLPKYTLHFSLWLCLLFVPTWWQGTPLALWFPHWMLYLGLGWWLFLLLHVPPKSPTHHPENTWIRGVLVGSTLTALLGILEYFYPSLTPWHGGFRDLISSTMGNPNHLAAYLTLALPFFFLAGRWWLLALIPCIFALLLTGSRMGILVATFVLLYSGIRLWRLRGISSSSDRMSRLVLLCGLGIFVGSFFLTPGKNLQNVTTTRGGLGGRLHLLSCAMPMMKDAFPFGLGIGEFSRQFPYARGKCLQRVKRKAERQHTFVFHLHNDWLELLLEGGLYFLFCFGLAFFWWYQHKKPSSRRIPKRTNPKGQKEPLDEHLKSFTTSRLVALSPSYAQRIWLDAVLIGFGLHMFASFPLYIAPVSALAVLALALRIRAFSATPPKPSKTTSKWLLWAVTLFLLLNVYAGARRHLSQRSFIHGLHAANVRTDYALSMYRRSRLLFPNVRSLYQEGQILLSIGKTRQALAAFHQALRLLPDPDIALMTARAYAQQGRSKRSCDMLWFALALKPNHKEARALSEACLTTASQLSPKRPARHIVAPQIPTTRPTSSPTSWPTSGPMKKSTTKPTTQPKREE
tara:strand:- start:1032 stop:2894 length:1863 start_codon:yes stop_codon:yes gene_type:complete